MRISALTLALPFLGGAAALEPRQTGESTDNTTVPFEIPRSFIIEYAPGHAKRRDGVASAEGITVVKSFDSTVFTGASIVTDSYNIDTLLALPDVLRVWPNERVQLAPILPEITNAAAGSNYTQTYHNSTGVSRLHELGFFGKGAKVGVVDTGIWYNHKALGGGYGANFKIVGGHDFVGNAFWPNDGVKAPDEDPIDQRGHGTHVAGIIAGQTDLWQGVAPEATLYAYKVFSQAESTDTATLIESFLAAYNDGVDIITASIGGPNGWADNAWAEVASRLVEEGVVVTISAGNSGDQGPAWGSSGSSGNNVVAVASIENTVFPSFPFGATFTVNGVTNTTTLGYVPSTNFFPSYVKDWPIVPLSFDTSNPAEACQPYPAGTRNLTGVIPLVRRGTCAFAVKQGNLAALGAEFILFYNNDSPLIQPGTSDVDTLIALTTAEVGASIINAYKANGTVTGDFSVNPENPIAYPNRAGGLANIFTQWGPLYGLEYKPDIAAPGGNIFSTYLDGQYAVLSGTSMACPYVAGIAALYIGAYGGRSVHGKGFAKSLHKKIISSGVSVPYFDGTTRSDTFTANVQQVGNGLVNAFKVLKYSTVLDYEKINLNDTHHFERYHDVIITNNAAKDVNYKFSVQDNAGFEILGYYPVTANLSTKRIKVRTELTPKKLPVEVHLPQDFTLRPGESRRVPVNFENPDVLGWNASALPIYSGKVIVSSSLGEQLSVPYAGLGANLQEELQPNSLSTHPYSKSSVLFKDIKEKASYTFNLSLNEQDFPKIYTNLIWGAREVRWDIFDADWHEHEWKYPPVPGQNGYIGTAAYWTGVGSKTYFDPRFDDANDTIAYPQTNVRRGAGEYWWFGKLGNGSQIELGQYRLRFATLRPFGDPTRSQHWDIFLEAPKIEVLGKY